MTKSEFDMQRLALPLSSLLVGLGVGAFYYKDWQKKKRNGKKIPPLCPAGTLATIDAIANGGITNFLIENFQKCGRIFRIRLPTPPWIPMVVVMADAEDARNVYKNDKNIKEALLYKAMEPFSSGPNMVSIVGGDDWFHRRKGVAPAFAPKHIKRMNQVVGQVIQEWTADKLGELSYTESVSFDVGREMIDVTISILCRAAFEYNTTAQERASLVDDIKVAWEEFTMKTAFNPLRPLLWFLLPERQRALAAAARLHAFAMNIIIHHKNNPSPTPNTVIDMIVKNASYKNDHERASDILIILFAGHDTTGFTLSFALMELAKNPEEQEKLRRSLVGNNDSNNKEPSESYLKAVLSETMRMHPVVPVSGFKTLGSDMVTSHGGYFIPKGSLVFMGQMAVVRDPKIFDNPFLFDPSRWLQPSEEMKRAVFPFALGSRNCVGQPMANSELHTVLPFLIERFHFSIELEGEIVVPSTLRLENCWLRARKVST